MQSATTNVHVISLKHLNMRHLEHFKYSGMFMGWAYPWLLSTHLVSASFDSSHTFFPNQKSIMNLLPCDKFPLNSVFFFSINSINCEHLEKVGLGKTQKLS